MKDQKARTGRHLSNFINHGKCFRCQRHKDTKIRRYSARCKFAYRAIGNWLVWVFLKRTCYELVFGFYFYFYLVVVLCG